MKQFFNSTVGKIIAALLIVILLAGAAFGGWQYWLYTQPKFQDVTIELGTASLGMDQFLTQYANVSNCRFVSDVSNLDIGKPGVYTLTMAHGSKEETVTLTVADTTAPEATFIPQLTKLTD